MWFLLDISLFCKENAILRKSLSVIRITKQKQKQKFASKKTEKSNSMKILQIYQGFV